MNEKERHQKVREYISLHQGCSPEEACKALKGDMARSTFFLVLGLLKERGQVVAKHVNKRDQKLYLKKDDPLVSVPIELREFEHAIVMLVDKTAEYIQDWRVSLTANALANRPGTPRTKILSFEEIKKLSITPMSIFYRMMDSYLCKCVMRWAKIIQDKETLKELLEIVYAKIAAILITLTQREVNKPEHDEEVNYSILSLQLEIIKRMGGVGTLGDYFDLYERAGLGQEIEAVNDSLWRIDYEIQDVIYKEPQYFGFNFDKTDGWKKLLELSKTARNKKHGHLSDR